MIAVGEAAQGSRLRKAAIRSAILMEGLLGQSMPAANPRPFSSLEKLAQALNTPAPSLSTAPQILVFHSSYNRNLNLVSLESTHYDLALQ
jgi:hypothetical protein